ncbi:MAG: sigma-54 dependent transcriptional regulator [Mariprofundaceae bacterium]
MAASPVWLIAFPPAIEADLRVQLGGVLSEIPIESAPTLPGDDFLQSDSLVFLFDSLTTEAMVTRLFSASPQANVVVLTEAGNQERAADLMRMGIMDYRILPCPDEILAIYARKAGHLAELNRQATSNQQSADIFITENTQTRRLLDQVSLVAPSRASILVSGESGTGKERLSRFIHQCSNRRDRAFIAVNCAAIPEGILESELFGHEKGAFTGATSARPGKFELAHKGTLLLDEITEMPIHLQAKLLRVLQEGEIDRLGGRAPVSIDVRVIATSNRDIEKAVANKEFREDLYYRLNVVTIRLPALRERDSDIEPLAKHFLARFSDMYGKGIPNIGDAALQDLKMYDWPGNVRELENSMHRAFLMCLENEILPEHISLPQAKNSTRSDVGNTTTITAGMSIRDMERALIRETVEHVQGNRTEAAKLLGISIRTLRNKLHDIATGTQLAPDSNQKDAAEISICNV